MVWVAKCDNSIHGGDCKAACGYAQVFLKSKGLATRTRIAKSSGHDSASIVIYSDYGSDIIAMLLRNYLSPWRWSVE